MKAWKLLQAIKAKGALPLSTEMPCEETSNAELKRWFTKAAILIDGEIALADDEIALPIGEVIFFPKGHRRTTMGPFIPCTCC